MKFKTASLIVFFVGALGAVFYFKPNLETMPVVEKVYHYSYFSQPEFYEEAYSQAKKIDPPSTYPFKKAEGENVGGLIVNHHLLAGQYIAEGFNAIATTAPVTVLLISPNHFSTGRSNVITSTAIWKTPYGELKPDVELINQLTTQGLVNTEEQPFEQEHGVSGIVAFIKKSLPNAQVVPVIIKDKLSGDEAKKFADVLSRIIDADKSARYILVGSFDFSHYLTAPAADFHDEVSLAAIENFDFNLASRLDIDSRPGLAMFLKLLQNQGFGQFNLLRQNNSAKLANLPETLETTSYITGYFSKGKAITEPVYSLLVLGQVENSSTTINSLNRNSPNFSVEFLERLFYGQEKTTAFVNKQDEKFTGLLNRFSIKHPIYTEEEVMLGGVKIGFSQNLANARKLIDQGAALAVSNGNNISIEQYKGKIIINGLGALLTQESLKINTQSLAAGFIVKDNLLKIYLFPIGFKNGQGKLLVGKENDIVLAELAAKSGISPELKEEIKNGILNIKITP